METDGFYMTLNGDDPVCGYCLSNSYSFCDECDGYYPDDESSEHEHDSDDCECESPAQSFIMRNDGEIPLKNDTRVSIKLPAGAIDERGLSRIRDLLANEAYALSGAGDVAGFTLMRKVALTTLQSIGGLWQTREGNFTKRLSRQAWKDHAYKISADILSTIGNIAREHSSGVSDYAIEVTRNLNLSAADFGHEDSCWWQSYSYSRCSLKSNGGFGLRSFDSDNDVAGRAWVQPIRCTEDGMSPTFDTVSPDAFVTYNGYDDMSGYTAARILAHMTGWTYRKVAFSAGNQYVNSGGYLVAPENIASQYDQGSICLDMKDHSNLHYSETHTSSI